MCCEHGVIIKATRQKSLTFHMDTKEIGNFGESTAAEYLRKNGFKIRARNVGRKTGEIDIIAEQKGTLHFVEVKTLSVSEFKTGESSDDYNPAMNIHEAKIRHIARTAEWYVAEIDWEGEWQLDAVLVWMRTRDGATKVEYIPQII